MGEDQKPLGTRERDEAIQLGRLLLAELLRGSSAALPHSLTLGQLWRRYSTECAEHLDNKERTRNGDAAVARVLLAHFGQDCKVADFTKDAQREFERRRMDGGIVLGDGTVTRTTRARSAQAGVELLHAMLNWATTVKGGDRPLLERNPLKGVKRVQEKNKKQPVATIERYNATMAAMKELENEARTDVDRVRWQRMRFALFLAECTGRRLGSIRQIRWEDFRFAERVMYWRADADKKGYKWEIPMPSEFFDRVREFQRELGAVGGHVFSAPDAKDGVSDRHWFDKWLIVAEKKAKLPKLDGGAWHPYRRKWAIERKHLPLKDVAAAGGWKDVNTLLEVYQQADDESVLAVMSETKKLHERGVA